nr:hypothetical protein [Tanacetum cinerariifolium]
CGHPVDGPYCQGCTLLRKKLEEDLVTYFQEFQNTFESSDDSTNLVNAPREPFVFKHDHSVNSSQNPPHIDECFYECGDALDGIFCQRCTCKSCGKGAHIGYNCPPKVPIISNPEPCNQTMNNEPLQTLPSFDPTCYSEKENSLPCVSKPNFVDEYSNVFNPPPQPPIYSCEFCGSNAQYGHYCTPQVSKPGYSQDFNFPQDFHDFQQQYFCCDQCGGPHETFQCIPDTMCDVHLVNHPNPLEAKDHFEIVINSNNDYSSSDDDSLYYENIEYVEASPHDSELVSLEVEEIVIPEDKEIGDDNVREKLLNVNLLIAKIKALKDNPTPSSEFLTNSQPMLKSSYKAEASVIISIPPLVGGVADVVVEIKGTGTMNLSVRKSVDYSTGASHSMIPVLVKVKQENDKIRTKPDENGKRGRAQQCQSPVTVKKAEKRRNTDSRDQYWQILEDVFIQDKNKG